MRVRLGEHVGDQWSLAAMPHCLTYPDERRQAPRGACLPSCSRTDVRSAAQPVGSFVTNASTSSTPLLKVVSKAPEVVG
jgi:hypothetical protein